MGRHQHELRDIFIEFFENYYDEDIEILAQNYPNDQRSLYLDYDDVYQFYPDLAEDYLSAPHQIQEYAEEALRAYNVSADVKLGHANIRLRNLPEQITLSGARVHDNHFGKLVSISGIIQKATDVQPKITDSAFECQRCGTFNYIPQINREFQEPHECQGCERQGPFSINYNQSEFIDHQKILLRDTGDGGSAKQIEVNLEDDIAGLVSAGDSVTVVGVLQLRRQDQSVSTDAGHFESYMDGVSVESNNPNSPNFPTDRIVSPIDMRSYAQIASTTLAGLPENAREEETKAKLITPFVEALGWNKFDNSEFRMEYTDSMTDRRPDYALFGEGSETPDVIVEAKQIGTELDDHINQVCDYLRIFSAKWGVLTNGEDFHIYVLASDENQPQKIAELRHNDLNGAAILDSLSRSSFFYNTDNSE